MLNENSYTHKVLIDALLKFKTLGKKNNILFLIKIYPWNISRRILNDDF